MRLIDDNVYRVSIINECKRLKIELKEAMECEDAEVILAIQNQLSAFELAIKLIDIQPTAFDKDKYIDKVVEELEKIKEEKRLACSEFDDEYDYQALATIIRAIEIVKAGGVHD